MVQVPSTQHLRDVQPGSESSSHAEKSVARIIIYGLPEDARKEFFPDATLDNQESQILQRNQDFVYRAAVHHLTQRFVSQSKVYDDIRKGIDSKRAELFWSAVTTKSAPPVGQQDPVAAYGWDRSKDADTIARYQEQCANVMLSCNRLGFIRATPEFEQHYLDNNPAEWYEKLKKHVTSAGYKTQFALEVQAGVHNIQILLVGLHSKLVLLREAANSDLKPDPQQVVVELCKKVAHDAIDMAQCDDDTKSRVREIIESIQRLGSEGTAPELQMKMNLVLIPGTDFQQMEEILKEEMKRTHNFLDSLLLAIAAGLSQHPVVKLTGLILQLVSKNQAEEKLNQKVKGFLEGHARQFGLF